jgi:hypothetical protein
VSFSYIDAEGRETDDWESKEAGLEEDAKAPPKDPLLPALIYVKLVFARSPEAQHVDADKDGGVVFRTAVALPEKAKAKK